MRAIVQTDLEEYLTKVYVKTINTDTRIKARTIDRLGFCHRLDERDLWLLSKGDYTKSQLVSEKYDGGIYFSNEPITYTHRIYEELIDSKGHTHYVQTDYEQRTLELSDEHLKLIYDGHVITSDECPIGLDHVTFQFNLKGYSLWTNLRGFSMLSYYRNLVDDIKNETPEGLWDRHWKKTEAMEASGWAPFWEHCFGRNECNYIPDEIFLNATNRKLALERVSCGPIGTDFPRKYNEMVFKGFDFVNADDYQLVAFMNDRFRRRIQYEQHIKIRQYFLTN